MTLLTNDPMTNDLFHNRHLWTVSVPTEWYATPAVFTSPTAIAKSQSARSPMFGEYTTQAHRLDWSIFFLMFTQLLGSLDSVLDPWFQNTDVSKDRGFTALVVTAGKTSTYNKHTESMEWHHYIFTVLRMEISLGTFFSNLFSIYKHCNIPAYLYCKLQSYSFC